MIQWNGTVFRIWLDYKKTGTDVWSKWCHTKKECIKIREDYKNGL